MKNLIIFFPILFILSSCGIFNKHNNQNLGKGFGKEIPKTEPVKPEELILSRKNFPLVSSGTAVFTDTIEIILSWGFDRITIKPNTKCEVVFDDKKNILKVYLGGDTQLGIPADAFLIFVIEEGGDENFVFKGWADHPGETAYQSTTSSELVKKFWKIEKGEGAMIKFTPNRKTAILPGKTGGVKK